MEEKRNSMTTCPGCGRHCPLDALSCPRGQEIAERLAAGEELPVENGHMEDTHHAPHGMGHPHHGPRHPDGMGGPHHGPHHPDGMAGPHHGLHHPDGVGGPHHGPHHPDGVGGSHHGPHHPDDAHLEPHDMEGAHHGPHHRPPHREHPCDNRPPMPEGRPSGHGPGFPPPPPDDDSLPGLMHRCMRQFHHARGASAQRRVLSLLAAEDGLSQQALMSQMRIQPGTLSEVINKLAEKGYVTREADAADRRRMRVRLTDAGLEAMGQMPEEPNLFTALTEEEQAQLKALLQKLLDASQG